MLNQLDENKYPLFVSFLKDNNIYNSYKKNASSIPDDRMQHSAIWGALYLLELQRGMISGII